MLENAEQASKEQKQKNDIKSFMQIMVTKYQAKMNIINCMEIIMLEYNLYLNIPMKFGLWIVLSVLFTSMTRINFLSSFFQLGYL